MSDAEERPVVGCPAIKVQGGALLILLHDYFTLRTPAVLAEVGLGKFRLYDVVVTSSHSEEAPVDVTLAGKP